MSKPNQVITGDTLNEYDSYNQNHKNRNSKLSKEKAYERDIDEDQIENKDIKFNFYNKNESEKQVD